MRHPQRLGHERGVLGDDYVEDVWPDISTNASRYGMFVPIP